MQPVIVTPTLRLPGVYGPIFYIMALCKIPKFYLISWCRNFTEKHSFHTGILGEISVFSMVWVSVTAASPSTNN